MFIKLKNYLTNKITNFNVICLQECYISTNDIHPDDKTYPYLLVYKTVSGVIYYEGYEDLASAEARKEIIDELDINGDEGGGDISLQDKTVSPTISEQSITADSGYDGLGTVTVEGYSLQDKEVTITQNGTQTITKDSGYDGLNSVEVTTSVPQPSGTINITENGTHDVSSYASAEVSVGGNITSTDELFSEYKKIAKKLDDYYKSVADNYEPIINESVTFYTPNIDYKNYIIIHTGNKYQILWLISNDIIAVDIQSDKLEYKYAYLSINNHIKNNYESKISALKLGGTYEYVYVSQQYNTIEDCINALKNNSTSYSQTSGGTYYSYSGISSPFYSNIMTFDNTNIQDFEVKRVSSNETIEVIPSE